MMLRIDTRNEQGYTPGVKTAISLPKDVFEQVRYSRSSENAWRESNGDLPGSGEKPVAVSRPEFCRLTCVPQEQGGTGNEPVSSFAEAGG